MVRAARGAAECRLCRERQTALSPNAVPERTTASGALPAVAVDVVHRVSSDPGRLSRAWYEQVLAAGLTRPPTSSWSAWWR